MIEPPISRQPNALVPPERVAAYVAVGWTVVQSGLSDGYGDERTLLRWEREGEPVSPAAAEVTL